MLRSTAIPNVDSTTEKIAIAAIKDFLSINEAIPNMKRATANNAVSICSRSLCFPDFSDAFKKASPSASVFEMGAYTESI